MAFNKLTSRSIKLICSPLVLNPLVDQDSDEIGYDYVVNLEHSMYPEKQACLYGSSIITILYSDYFHEFLRRLYQVELSKSSYSRSQ